MQPPGNASASGTFALGGDLPVHRLGFGTMRLTGPGAWGEAADVDGARRVLRRALTLGVTLLDTADAYGPEVAERLIADTLRPYPAELVIATKGGLVRDGPDEWRPNGRPEHLRSALEASLRRLRLERIDLYQLHAPDPDVPLDESVGALEDLRSQGKLRHIGLSNVDVAQLEMARRYAPVAAVQNRFNVLDRDAEPVLEACTRLGLAFLPWRPLAEGEAGRAAGVRRVAADHGASAEQVALAWLLRRAPGMLPIPGTSSIRHLEENIGAVDVALSEGDMEILAEAAQAS